MVVRVFALCVLMFASVASAGHNELLIERVNAKFSYTWLALDKTIKANGYKAAYLQRCDFALNERHYKSDKYRILFFGQYDEMKRMSAKYPKLSPFFPLKITVMEEGKHTLIIAAPPITLLPLVKTDEDRMLIFRWNEDMKNILKQVKNQYK
ncbi:hypothetical protein [Candidatus Thioglobus sp.]|jgi:uncharacterized protein (DUF302 family)|uniref:hypothetical protein n=1 Tax=Candidatus Thioglobus sp. TaxID=2026721 RepID=UPI001D80633B|nr:hypothetical protein [Candidatus Thioglobus sp.]MBT3276715.1 DUF302 domain-containing protein [Candidatus Thioglobus sp.]MBT3446909.1 DUF302 domain-containing protein [Candidatus Thioglobus sp.]MBT4000629.1 DUF302 domain-containing protein [Candidatus Thioglobus sp.]MBT4182361.1 DUF302 domain-containing protein [Candidatus Thioglobus sp.]MBT4553014.1 DUF302 domain-containing protein [Candidatus Thioglobus sp.]